MTMSFSRLDQKHIKRQLVHSCKQNWVKHGYKKTNIEMLCKSAGISKGSFYSFFESKEVLFYEIYSHKKKEHFDTILKILDEDRTKTGPLKALKYIYDEYDENKYLYTTTQSDFSCWTNKIYHDPNIEIISAIDMYIALFTNIPYLSLKVDSEMAASIYYSLIMNISIQNKFSDYQESFYFMAKHLIEAIYD